MTPVAGDGPTVEDDAAALARYADDLATAVEAAIGPWVVAAVNARHPGPSTPELEAAVTDAAARALADVGPRLRALLALDIDEQWTNPLAVLRSAVVHPTAVLADAGVAPVHRDATDERINPEDVYALAPATFADLGEAVHEPGLVWGAAKAHLHLRRRREEGSR